MYDPFDSNGYNAIRISKLITLCCFRFAKNTPKRRFLQTQSTALLNRYSTFNLQNCRILDYRKFALSRKQSNWRLINYYWVRYQKWDYYFPEIFQQFHSCVLLYGIDIIMYFRAIPFSQCALVLFLNPRQE